MSEATYKLVVNAKDGENGIEITGGKYEGVIYTYGEVQFLPVENEDEPPTINFTRAVRKCPDSMKETISEDVEFNQIMGDILIEMLEQQGDKAVELLKDEHKESKSTEVRNHKGRRCRLCNLQRPFRLPNLWYWTFS